MLTHLFIFVNIYPHLRKRTKEEIRHVFYCYSVRRWDFQYLHYTLSRLASGYLLFVGRTRRITQYLTPTFVALLFCIELSAFLELSYDVGDAL